MALGQLDFVHVMKCWRHLDFSSKSQIFSTSQQEKVRAAIQNPSTFRRPKGLKTFKDQSAKHYNHSEAAEFPPMLHTCSTPEAISSFRVPAVCVLFVQVISLTEVNVSDLLLFWSFSKAAVARPGEEDAPLFVSALFSGILIRWPPWPLLPGLLPFKKQTEGWTT